MEVIYYMYDQNLKMFKSECPKLFDHQQLLKSTPHSLSWQSSSFCSETEEELFISLSLSLSLSIYIYIITGQTCILFVWWSCILLYYCTIHIFTMRVTLRLNYSEENIKQCERKSPCLSHFLLKNRQNWTMSRSFYYHYTWLWLLVKRTII